MIDLDTLIGAGLLALKIGGLVGYVLLAGLCTNELRAAIRSRKPYRAKLVKAGAYVAIALKALFGG